MTTQTLAFLVQGLGEGVTFPAMNSLFSDWAPPLERSRLSTIAFSGAQLGTILSLPISGILCQSVSWDSVFYISGVMGLIWFAIWMYYIANSPSTCRRISLEEKVIDTLSWFVGCGMYLGLFLSYVSFLNSQRK